MAGSGTNLSFPLWDNNLYAKHRLFLTATPRLYKTLNPLIPAPRSMDNASVFGRVVHHLSWAEAQAANITVPVSHALTRSALAKIMCPSPLSCPCVCALPPLLVPRN